MPTLAEADAVIDAIDRVRRRQHVPKVIHDIIDSYRVFTANERKPEYPLLAAVNDACRNNE